ncbi:hypothetical protein OKE68_08075 [Riemerella anatipestifer]|uniref:Uncharacterized protein n=1 Tax=Riemerella anatipestifer TaxID=34085 RepID=A0A1S7DQR4_RIEAN|nr:hypothetical protein [Riemerella anatipestifer]AQY21460.1 hypothetical protein AB406_0502 [Riemerella anatipestifer]MBT0573640.1 hypothetical protein [Riemerella anatipestifer]MCQ4154538.1 hypothetical protein [Riemerella anatipestifer]MCQ4180531.1 hypothetical protein [Riemerella anatipestifer]MCU7567461.1 hypothetical protein [Riemerella anatipestifer]
MKFDNNFLEYALLFIAATFASIYHYLKNRIKDVWVLVTHLLFGCFIAFVAVPYIGGELMGLSFKGNLFFTWILTYFSDTALRVFFKTVFTKIDPEFKYEDEQFKNNNNNGNID